MAYNKEQQMIIAYLKEKVDEGNRFFKAKYIGKDIGLSPRCIGTNLYIISKKIKSLKIVQYSEALSTTWKVEPV